MSDLDKTFWEGCHIVGGCNPLHRKDAAIAELVMAGRSVVDRWDSPLWKDLPHTGEYIAQLRTVCEKYDIHKDGYE